MTVVPVLSTWIVEDGDVRPLHGNARERRGKPGRARQRARMRERVEQTGTTSPWEKK